MPGRSVMVAVDGSDPSKNAFEWFVENVYKSDDLILVCHIPEIPDLCSFSFKWFMKNVYKDEDEVVICHVPESPHLHFMSFKAGLSVPVDEWQKSVQEVRSKTDKILQDYEFMLLNKNIKKYKCVGEHTSKVGAGILEEAVKNHVDLIAVGTRSQDALGRTFRGSVSDYVAHHSQVPVMIIPMPK